MEDIQTPSKMGQIKFKKFHNVFDPPGIPVDRDTVHQIELLPNAEPHYRC